MKLGGIMGSARYKGSLTPFIPYLKLGTYTHIGKNTTFGFGRYSLTNP
jgi:CRISPR/Cas system endoribonuclease Cas6 (RAMP superfamily)